MIMLAVNTVQRCLEPLGVACYLRDGERYVCARQSGNAASAAAPAATNCFCRWRCAARFSDFWLAVLSPTTRGIPDEISALSLLANHAGIASAWLTQPAVVPPLRIPVT